MEWYLFSYSVNEYTETYRRCPTGPGCAGGREGWEAHFFVKPRGEATLGREGASCHTNLECRGLHPTGGGTSGQMLYARTRLRGVVWNWHQAYRFCGSICFAREGVSTPQPLKTLDACKALISSAGFETYRDGFRCGKARNLSAGFHRFPPAVSRACHTGVGPRLAQ